MRVNVIRTDYSGIGVEDESKVNYNAIVFLEEDSRRAVIYDIVYYIVLKIFARYRQPMNERLVDTITDCLMLYNYDKNCNHDPSILSIMKYNIRNCFESVQDSAITEATDELYDLAIQIIRPDVG